MERTAEPLVLPASEASIDRLTLEVLFDLLASLWSWMVGEEVRHLIDQVGFVECSDAREHPWDRVARETVVEVVPVVA